MKVNDHALVQGRQYVKKLKVYIASSFTDMCRVYKKQISALQRRERSEVRSLNRLGDDRAMQQVFLVDKGQQALGIRFDKGECRLDADLLGQSSIHADEKPDPISTILCGRNSFSIMKRINKSPVL